MIEALIPQIQAYSKLSSADITLLRSGDEGLLSLATEELLTHKKELSPFLGWLHENITKEQLIERFKVHAFSIDNAKAPFVNDYFITDKQANIIGGISFVIDQSAIPSFLIGNLWVLPKYQQQGFALKSVTLLCEHLHKNLQAKRIETQIEPENISSLKTFTKAGFTEEGLKKSGHLVGNRICDVLIYAKTF